MKEMIKQLKDGFNNIESMEPNDINVPYKQLDKFEFQLILTEFSVFREQMNDMMDSLSHKKKDVHDGSLKGNNVG